MEILHSKEVEDVYQNYKYELVFNEAFEINKLKALTKKVTLDVDESINRTSFIADMKDYKVFGYLKSNRILVSSDRKTLLSNANKFIEKINELWGNHELI